MNPDDISKFKQLARIAYLRVVIVEGNEGVAKEIKGDIKSLFPGAKVDIFNKRDYSRIQAVVEREGYQLIILGENIEDWPKHPNANHSRIELAKLLKSQNPRIMVVCISLGRATVEQIVRKANDIPMSIVSISRDELKDLQIAA